VISLSIWRRQQAGAGKNNAQLGRIHRRVQHCADFARGRRRTQHYAFLIFTFGHRNTIARTCPFSGLMQTVASSPRGVFTVIAVRHSAYGDPHSILSYA
jgi:hypothetical protein